MARVKHGEADWQCYHVTTRTLNSAFWLASDREKNWIIEALRFYLDRNDFLLFAYVIMSNHVHLVLQPNPGRTLGGIMAGFKRWTSRHNSMKPAGSSLWERRYDDNRIHSTKELHDVVRYIHQNPVHAGMVSEPEDYQWSSVHCYLGQKALLPVITNWFG
jgi:putative transposase